MHYVDSVTRERVHKVIQNNKQGSFVYATLAPVNEHFADEIQSATKSEQLLAVWDAMKKRAFLSYRIDGKSFAAEEAAIKAMDLKDLKQFLMDVLDKNMLYAPLSEMEDE